MSILDLTIGALEIGILLSTVLYGILTLQAYRYTEGQTKDPLWIPVMVTFVWVLETVHTVFLWILLYGLTVTNYGKPDTLDDIPWSFAITFPLSAWLGSITQIFFAYRVRVLSGRMIIPVLAWGGSILRCFLGTTAGGLLLKTKSIQLFFAKYQWLVTTPFVLNVVVDVLNTCSLCFYLLRRRSASKPTQRMISKLVRFTIETGLITSLCAIAIAICSLILHDSIVYMGLFLIYPKLFSNSLFTSLNAREDLRNRERNSTHAWNTGAFAQRSSGTESSSAALELTSKPTDNVNTVTLTRVPSPSPSSTRRDNSGKGNAIV